MNCTETAHYFTHGMALEEAWQQSNIGKWTGTAWDMMVLWGEKKKQHKTNHLCPSLWNDGAINSSNFSSKDWSVNWELLSNDSLFHLFFLCCVEYILVGLERGQSHKQYLAEEFLYVQKEIPADNIHFTASSQRKWITANHAKLTWKITRDVKDVKLGLGYWISEFVSLLVLFLSLWFQIWKQF